MPSTLIGNSAQRCATTPGAGITYTGSPGTAQFPLLWTPDPVIAVGLYRASLYFVNRNVTAGSKFTAFVQSYDPQLNTFVNINFQQLTGGTGNAGQFLTGSQTNGVGSNQAVVCSTLHFAHVGGQQIGFGITDPAGSPNFTVWCSLELLQS